MLNLYDFDLHDVFYRGYPILLYLEEHPDLDVLDKECLSNTILDALVYKNLIDPEKQSLDLEHCCIQPNLDFYCYQKHPRVVGIPLKIKEQIRKKRIVQSGNMPISFQLCKPTFSIARYCLYDPLLCMSILFDDFSLDDYIYDSPTRKGVRLKENESRPFLDVSIDGVHYLIDVLLKRMYEKDFFIEQFRAVKTKERTKKRYLSSEFRKEYLRLTTSTTDTQMAAALLLLIPFFTCLCNQKEYSELFYEVEKSKEIFPEAWSEYERLKQEENPFKFLYNKSV